MPRRRPLGVDALCCVCSEHVVKRIGDLCQSCREWMRRYRSSVCGLLGTMLVREIHALRQRAAAHLPLFVDGHLQSGGPAQCRNRG